MEIAKGIPNADLRNYERSSHSVATDEPEAYMDVIKGFVTYNSGARR